jgi:alpha-galactosidase
MRPLKIVVIGAGSVSFGLRTVADICRLEEFRGSTLSLVDLDAESLQRTARAAARINEEWSSGLEIEHTTDRSQALPDADFVIICIELDRIRRWRMDWEIPLKYGVRQPMGENGGPGGLAHALRVIPPILAVAEEMELRCPGALMLNFTNPVPRVCLAVHRYTNVEVVGMCHGISGMLGYIGGLLGRRRDELDCTAAGINHFTWIMDLRHAITGADLYPALRERIAASPPPSMPLTWALFGKFGLVPSPGDNHIAEYLQLCHAPEFKPWEKYQIPLYDWDADERRRPEARRRLERIATGAEPIEDLRAGSGEIAADIMRAVTLNRNERFLAVNVPNQGYISNLRQDGIVEVPGMGGGFGVRGIGVGALPEPIAALCNLQMAIAELVAEAAATGSRRAALHALLIDPMVNDIETAEKILEELLAAHADLLPQFGR